MFGFFVFASAGLPGLSGFVGEFLTLVGTFEVNVWAAAIATVVMVLAAGYLLYMYGRLVFGEVSDFLKGLGDHLTDMTPVEILTLVPLATLIVVFGVQPGLLLDLVQVTVDRPAPRRPRPERPSRSGRRSSSPAWPSSSSSSWPASAGSWPAAASRGGAPAATPGDRGGGALMADDVVLIAPLIAAVLTAAAILVVDLIWPGRSPIAIATALIGLGVTAARDHQQSGPTPGLGVRGLPTRSTR